MKFYRIFQETLFPGHFPEISKLYPASELAVCALLRFSTNTKPEPTPDRFHGD